MAAFNDITGDCIKTKPSSKQFLSNYDKAFRKKKPSDWAKDEGITIMDPDGWRVDKKSMDEEISYKEYRERVSQSTVMGKIP